MSGERPLALAGRGPVPARSGGPSDDAGDLSPERCAEIQRRIAEGAYDTWAMADLLARRLVESGDIEPPPYGS